MKQFETETLKNLDIAELRVGATLLAERSGLLGKGVTYDSLLGDKDVLIRVIERAKKRMSKKKTKVRRN